jgi:adenine phosphoribosyltransferase
MQNLWGVMNQLLKESLKTASILNKKEYRYLIHPLFDGFPFISPKLLMEVANDLNKLIKPYLPFDKIVTVEAMGIPIATQLSIKMDIPFVIIRKRQYGFSDEIKIQQQTGYATSELFINGFERHEKVIVVDDILSTGATIQAIINALQRVEVVIKAGFFIVDKGDSLKDISKKTDIHLHALAKINVKSDNVIIQEK